MNILKKHNSDKYLLTDLSDEELIALYNLSINYGEYLQQIKKLSDESLLQTAPGMDAKQVRHNIDIQEKFCIDFIAVWQEIINTDKKQG